MGLTFEGLLSLVQGLELLDLLEDDLLDARENLFLHVAHFLVEFALVDQLLQSSFEN